MACAPLVSVVIPCFRCAGTIGRAVNSVLRQTVPVREIVLVDDCSGDGTLDRLREIEASNSVLVRVIALPRNLGPASARNTGWEAAQGELVAFLDSDDTWHASKIEFQQTLMSSQPAFSLSGHAHRWIRGAMTEDSRPEAGFDEVGLRTLLLSNRITTSSAMVRRAVALRFTDGQRHMEDHRLWLGIAASGLRVARLRAVLSYRYAAPFGESGLSANLLAMQRAELSNYLALYRSGAVSVAWLAALVPWSLAKFVRRLAVTAARGLAG